MNWIIPAYVGSLMSIWIVCPKAFRAYDNYTTEHIHKCLSENYVPVDKLENHILVNCKNKDFCKVRLDSPAHSKKANEVIDKHFKNGNYFISEKYCHECKEYMKFLFVSKTN